MGAETEQWCRETAAWVHSQSNDPRTLRLLAMTKLAAKLNAKSWLWAFSAASYDRTIPISLDHLHAGELLIRERLAYLRRMFAVDEMPPENPAIHAMVMEGKPFALGIRALVADQTDYWNSPNAIGWLRRVGMSDILHVVMPLRMHEKYRRISCISLSRAAGEPHFSANEGDLVNTLVSHIPAFKEDGRNLQFINQIALFTPALRVVVALLSGGFSCKQIGAKSKEEPDLSSPGTVSQQAKTASRVVTGTYSYHKMLDMLGFGRKRRRRRKIESDH
jgi:hypothetical protein